MAKKQRAPTNPPGAGIKKGKVKRKQMFNELETIHQQKINQKQENQMIDQEYYPQKIQEVDQQIGQKIIIGKEKSIEEVCQAVNQLIAKNKVNVKNAFDVPIIDLFDLINFNKKQTQNQWKNLSATFENDYKIYGYRVDAIHDITYSILNIMARRSNQSEQIMKPELTNTQNNNLLNSSPQFSDLKSSFLQNIDSDKTHLQMDSNKINISMIECALTSDPTLQRTKRLFDQPGLKGMLTNSIHINKDLQLTLFSHNQKKQHYSMKLSDLQEIDTKSVQHPLKVFQSIEKIKTDLNKLLKTGNSQILSNKELQQIWANVKKCNFNDWSDGNQKVWLDVEDPQYRENFDMMIDENSALFENITSKKFIGDYLKMKNLFPSKKIMTDQELIQDGEKWLNQIDRKFLGIKTSNTVKPEISTKPISKPIDDVDFKDTRTYDRDQILCKEQPTKQFNEQIEDRFLMTIRPFSEFKIQKILTLREQPQIQLHAFEQQMALQNDNEHFLQKQIDVKRQMTSIKDMKDNLLEKISERKMGTFSQVYQQYCKNQGEISPALCFLTMLHLANEKNLSFQSIQNQTDFSIKFQIPA